MLILAILQLFVLLIRKYTIHFNISGYNFFSENGEVHVNFSIIHVTYKKLVGSASAIVFRCYRWAVNSMARRS